MGRSPSRAGDIRLLWPGKQNSQPPDSRTYSTEVTTENRCNLPLHRIIRPASSHRRSSRISNTALRVKRNLAFFENFFVYFLRIFTGRAAGLEDTLYVFFSLGGKMWAEPTDEGRAADCHVAALLAMTRLLVLPQTAPFTQGGLDLAKTRFTEVLPRVVGDADPCKESFLCSCRGRPPGRPAKIYHPAPFLSLFQYNLHLVSCLPRRGRSILEKNGLGGGKRSGRGLYLL